MTHNQFYLKNNDKQIPVSIDPVVGGLVVTVQDERYEIVGSRAGWATVLNQLLALQPQAEPHPILQMSPGDVIAYFEQSPILHDLVDDLIAAFGNTADPVDIQLERDVAAVQHLASPRLADISEVLTGERHYSGSTYKRVKAVADALKSSTSPAEMAGESEDQAYRAA